MSMSVLTVNAKARREELEVRIALHMGNVANGFLGVGLCLIEAKESDCIAHGEWETWVREQTGMSVRQAQRLMQVAREVTPGSKLAGLPISKIQAILTLPAAEREGMAIKATEEDMTVIQLHQEIDALKETQQRDAQAAKALLQEKDSLVSALKSDLAKAKLKAESQSEPDGSLLAEIERLKGELRATEDYAAEQARLRQEVQETLLDQQQAGAREEQREILAKGGVQVLTLACRRFFSDTACLKAMEKEFVEMPYSDRQQVRDYLDVMTQTIGELQQLTEATYCEGAVE